MTLTAFRSEDGSALLIGGSDGRTLLVDGGTQEGYGRVVARTISRRGANGATIDRICVRSPAGGYLSGVRQLFDDAVAWRVYDYQTSTGNTKFPRPDNPRPPKIGGVWCNSAQDLGGSIFAVVTERLAVQTHLLSIAGDPALTSADREIVAAIDNSSRLTRRLNQLNVQVNPEFMGGLLYPRPSKSSVSLGRMHVHLLGPSARSIAHSRNEWERWLADTTDVHRRLLSRLKLDDSSAGPEGDPATDSLFAEIAEFRASRIEPPWFPALILLVEADQATVLLAGEVNGSDILQSLSSSGRLPRDGAAHFTVLEHSGRADLVTSEFFTRVTADHYVFAECGSDAPSVEAIEVLLKARLERVGSQDAACTLWFANSAERASELHRESVTRLQAIVQRALKGRPKVRARFLTRGDALDIAV